MSISGMCCPETGEFWVPYKLTRQQVTPSASNQVLYSGEDERMRANAIEAYSKIEGPQHEEIMMRQLAQEAAPAFKREIYRALFRLPVSPLTARAAVKLLPLTKREQMCAES